MNKNWLLPLKLGIPAAVALGYLNSADSIRTNCFLSNGLYYTAAGIFTEQANRFILPLLGVLYLLFALILLISRHRASFKLPGWINVPISILALIGLISLLGANAATAILHRQNIIANKTRPNVLFVIIDALRADHLGCYGYGTHDSPNIDSLANEGIRFNHAVPQAPWTFWSISSMLTSRYPESMRLGMATKDMPVLPEGYGTFAEILKDSGYSTAAVINNPFIDRQSRLNRGYDKFDDVLASRINASDRITTHALAQLRDLNGKPFFLTLHYLSPHAPYYLHEGFDFYPDYRGTKQSPIELIACNDLASFSADDLKFTRALYDSGIAYTDHYLGDLLTQMKKMGLYENTMIVVVSDHGEEFMEHGHCNHGDTLYNELLNVACIVKLPNEQRKAVVGGTFPMINLMPSILKYLNLAPDRYKLQGAPVNLADITKCNDDYVYSAVDLPNPNKDGSILSIRSVQNDRYKFIISHPGTEMLFDLANDFGEKTNIINREPKVHETLKQALLAHEEIMDSRGPTHTRKMTKEERDKMRSLGYAQ